MPLPGLLTPFQEVNNPTCYPVWIEPKSPIVSNSSPDTCLYTCQANRSFSERIHSNKGNGEQIAQQYKDFTRNTGSALIFEGHKHPTYLHEHEYLVFYLIMVRNWDKEEEFTL